MASVNGMGEEETDQRTLANWHRNETKTVRRGNVERRWARAGGILWGGVHLSTLHVQLAWNQATSDLVKLVHEAVK